MASPIIHVAVLWQQAYSYDAAYMQAYTASVTRSEWRVQRKLSFHSVMDVLLWTLTPGWTMRKEMEIHHQTNATLGDPGPLLVLARLTCQKSMGSCNWQCSSILNAWCHLFWPSGLVHPTAACEIILYTHTYIFFCHANNSMSCLWMDKYDAGPAQGPVKNVRFNRIVIEFHKKISMSSESCSYPMKFWRSKTFYGNVVNKSWQWGSSRLFLGACIFVFVFHITRSLTFWFLFALFVCKKKGTLHLGVVGWF